MSKYSLHKVVTRLLKEDTRCRKDIKWLVYCVWGVYTKIYIPYNSFENIPSPESIARCKRTIQNKENKFNSEKFIPEEGITYEKRKT